MTLYPDRLSTNLQDDRVVLSDLVILNSGAQITVI